MVACPAAIEGHQGAFAERDVVVARPPARPPRPFSTSAVGVSVVCGRMVRMSKESEPEAELPDYAERVLEVTELIPRGRVMTYGDVAEWLQEGGPRQVGRVMALYGGAVPWWRVVRADGALLPGHELRALAHYREENTPLRDASRASDGHLPRLDMKRARWDGRAPTEAHT
ncbi:MGMT family protein [Streptomyces sp. GXMU-J5]|uniref:MGMT family protein n=2 Tax=Streptomyces beihaiensis TaxID=2984495 RepID=A0ABT3TQK9_9ACTN|nr:MGMT family protein [Streptomyces beihaiensis]